MRSAPVLTRCHSLTQLASFGPPPRTPGRPDPQVPEELGAGPAIYAKLPHIYFYDSNRPDDPAFGFIEIEISIQRRGERSYRLDLSCVGDGHQSGAGLPNGEGLRVELLAGDDVVASVPWLFREVSSGRCDPVTFSASPALSDDDYRTIDRVRLPSAAAVCRIDG